MGSPANGGKGIKICGKGRNKNILFTSLEKNPENMWEGGKYE